MPVVVVGLAAAPFCTSAVSVAPLPSCALVKAGIKISSSWFSVKKPLLLVPRLISSVVALVAVAGMVAETLSVAS